MRLTVTILVVLALTAFAVTPAQADADGHVNFFIGRKVLNSNDWQPVDNQLEFGAVMSFGRDDWPVHIAVDVMTSVDKGNVATSIFDSYEVTGRTFEGDVGVRRIWKKGKIFPYLGAGVGYIGARTEGLRPGGKTGPISLAATSGAFGYWADSGVFFRLGGKFNIGLDVRYSTADVELSNGSSPPAENVNAGGFGCGLLLGFGW